MVKGQVNIDLIPILIGYYTVLCTIWKDIVRVGIVLKTGIGRDVAGVVSNTGFQYNTDEF